MIDMMLGFGAVNETPLIGTRTVHESINVFIMLTAFLCVPVMLFVKPIILIRQLRQQENNNKPGAIEMGV